MGQDLASTDAPMGFAPWGNVLRANIYAIVTNNSVAVSIGDLVEVVGEAVTTPHFGYLQKVITEETGAAGSIAGVVLATFDSDYYPVSHIAASTTGNGTIAGYALVADHPDQIYVAQEDGDTSSIVAANIGLNADAISTHSPAAANNYLSKMEIDSSTVATTATLALKIIGVHPDDTISSDGSAGNHCRFICKINTAHLGSGIVGV